MTTEETKISRKRQYIAIALMAAVIIVSVGGSIFLVFKWEYVERLQESGLWGLFIISLFAGSPIPIPTPSMILTFTLGSLLNPALVGLVSGVGNGLGNMLVYWSGRGGLVFFKSFNFAHQTGEPSSRIGRFFRKLKISQWMERSNRGVMVTVFLLSLYPNPVLTPMLIGMGASRFSFTKFSIAIFAGKIAQSMILAYLGYFGLRSLLQAIGIF